MSNSISAQKSISDDDLCSGCQHCQYSPGELSTCSKGWPGTVDGDGYIQSCATVATGTGRGAFEITEMDLENVHSMEYKSECVAAALKFKAKYTKALCRKLGYQDWRDALQAAWHQGWDEREADGGWLRYFRNDSGFVWLSEQQA